ncbi:hypothetical protein [Desulfitobacterium chlororespirans]|uniref:Uncharacterized protein n=1 Tax=Desulfitobacterium chlororespirans DSM 11544 TaxID=1121395 RepID=A0A1M7UT75_9FIRM|nr:hypothetical protein [Desulfitobacterium chlororespirans]SHN86192.1 hypothetical protein SAMN02745215_04605 [Desulfitobacterium chlororespirans DSM 11544]
MLHFKQAVFEPVVYKANNALVAYVPRYTIRTKMNQSMERLSFMKEAKAKGLTIRMLNNVKMLEVKWVWLWDWRTENHVSGIKRI